MLLPLIFDQDQNIKWAALNSLSLLYDFYNSDQIYSEAGKGHEQDVQKIGFIQDPAELEKIIASGTSLEIVKATDTLVFNGFIYKKLPNMTMTSEKLVALLLAQLNGNDPVVKASAIKELEFVGTYVIK